MAVPGRARAALLTLLGAIVAADLAQPLLLAWQPRFVAALGGATIYTLAGVGVWTGRRQALLVVAILPIVPVGTIALWAVGAPVPVRPSAPMVAIAGLQVTAGVLAAITWRRAAMASP